MVHAPLQRETLPTRVTPSYHGGPLTANIEAGARQDAAVASMAHEVVTRLLPGSVEVGQGEGQGGRVEHTGELRG